MLAESRVTAAEAPPKDAAAPAAPASSTSAPSGTGNPGETDALGRSRWWPSASASSNTGGDFEPPSQKPEALRPFQQGVLFLPYAGISVPLGTGTGSYSLGHNLGVFLGLHLTPRFSLNAEVSVDFMGPGGLARESQTDVTLSPLLHSRGPRGNFVFGAKLGVFSFSRVGSTDTYGRSANYSTTGFVWGLTFGGFVPVGPMAFGVLARFTFRHAPGNCDGDREGTVCNEGAGDGISPVFKTFDLSAAALF
jgi:hypothetical protein